MMTRTITTHPKVNWKELESGKPRGKKKRLEPGKLEKKKLTHLYSHSHREVHTSRHDGEKA